MAGVDIALRNSARTIVVTKPDGLLPGDYPFVEDLDAEWYFRPEKGGALMGMGTRPVDTPEVGLDGEQVEAIIDHAAHRVPALGAASLLTAWTGVRPLTPDGRPIVGRYPGLDGFVFNCGWGGVGFIMAPVAGQLAAECVMQGAIQMVDSAAMDPGRAALRGDGAAAA